MVKYLVFVVIVCIGAQTYAQRKPNIKGNRNVVEVREDLPAFTSIELIDNLEVFIERGPTSGYSISADDNLIDILKFQVEGDKLIISSFYNVTAKKQLEITIFYEELNTIKLLDGKITTKSVLSADHLEVDVLGYSRVDLNAKASLLNIRMEGNSFGEFNVESDSLNIALKDKIEAQIYAIGETHAIEMQDSASALLEGTTEVLQLQLHGTSKLKAERMEATTVHANLDGSASGWVLATKALTLSSKGDTHTYLYGEPQITIADFLDTSELHKRKN